MHGCISLEGMRGLIIFKNIDFALQETCEGRVGLISPGTEQPWTPGTGVMGHTIQNHEICYSKWRIALKKSI